MRFTLGFSTLNDPGAWWTVNMAIEYHSHLFTPGEGEVLIIDDSPRDSKWATDLENMVKSAKNVRYVRAIGPESSCLYKDRMFQEAKGDVVVCCDSHVAFRRGALDAVIEYLETTGNERDLVMGLCKPQAWKYMGSNQALYTTECYDLTKDEVKKRPDTDHGVVMRGGAAGIWVNDERAQGDEPFEIMQQGTGAFAMRRENWVGFHPSFWGHGGNETYLMERVREEGGRVMCHPKFQWLHSFYRSGGPAYAVRWPPKVKNYLTTAIELRRSDLYDAFVDHLKKQCKGTVTKILNSGEYPRPVGAYEEYMKALGVSDEGGGVLPRPAIEFIRRHVRPGSRTIEFGSGVSTLAFEDRGTQHTAIECDERWVKRVRDALHSTNIDVIRADLDENGWYDTQQVLLDRRNYDLILIDGPMATRNRLAGRLGCPRNVGLLLNRDGVLIVDDTHRGVESQLAIEIAAESGLRRNRVACGKRAFDMLRKK